MMNYIIGIDQSTQGTKALLFNDQGQIVHRNYLAHEQLVNQQGWVSHDPLEIYQNMLKVVRQLVNETKLNTTQIAGIGIANQRETSVVWEKHTQNPIANAIVWQCSRAKKITDNLTEAEEELIKSRTGLTPSPYFPAAKYSWLLKEYQGLKTDICCGTIDAWLLYKLTEGKSFKTDFSNASRTQLLNLSELTWDEDICKIFDIPLSALPKVVESDSFFGETDFEGLFVKKVPILSMMGDSHAALYAQQGFSRGATKVTYGTGSSVMMNVGEELPPISQALSTSIGWKTKKQLVYVLEGNINYTGAIMTWLKDDLKLINSPDETENIAGTAHLEDTTYLVPAFSGLSAPFWRDDVTALLTGMTRLTGKAEIIKAALESIAYQINSVLQLMVVEAGIELNNLCVDGGPTKNKYLMQFQSDISAVRLHVSEFEEASCVGVAYLAGMTSNIYSEQVFANLTSRKINPKMSIITRKEKLKGWQKALDLVLKGSD